MAVSFLFMLLSSATWIISVKLRSQSSSPATWARLFTSRSSQAARPVLHYDVCVFHHSFLHVRISLRTSRCLIVAKRSNGTCRVLARLFSAAVGGARRIL